MLTTFSLKIKQTKNINDKRHAALLNWSVANYNDLFVKTKINENLHKT